MPTVLTSGMKTDNGKDINNFTPNSCPAFSPVNYINILSREHIERMILADKPTMLFTEYDRTFVERIATQTVILPNLR